MLPKPDCTFTIPSLHDDLELDGRLYFPRRPANTTGAYVKGFVLLAHPYALLGGSWDDPVVQIVGAVLLRQGFVLNTFNFRGASDSAGGTSWTGRAEVGDFVSFYALLLFLVNAPDITDQICSSSAEDVPSKPLLVLGGYSFGSMIASHVPSLDVVAKELTFHAEGSAEQEIYARADELSKALLGFLELQDYRGRSSLRLPDTANARTSNLVVTMGGYESEVAGRRISRESSRRSLDVDTMRHSLDRIKHKLGHHNNSPKGGELSDKDESDGATSSPLKVLPRLAFLLISPILPPISGFITFFSKPSFDFRGRISRTSTDQQMLNLSENPSLAVYGAKDVFTSGKKLTKWSEEVSRITGSKFQHTEVDGAGHFWREAGVEGKLKNELTKWATGLHTG